MLGVDGELNGLKVDTEEVNKDKRLPDLKILTLLILFFSLSPSDAHMNFPDTVGKSGHLTSVRKVSGIMNTCW